MGRPIPTSMPSEIVRKYTMPRPGLSNQRRSKLHQILAKENSKDPIHQARARHNDQEVQHLLDLREKLSSALSTVEDKIVMKGGAPAYEGSSRGGYSARSYTARSGAQSSRSTTQRSWARGAPQHEAPLQAPRPRSARAGLAGSGRTPHRSGGSQSSRQPRSQRSAASEGVPGLFQAHKQLRGVTKRKLLECWRRCELKATGGMPSYHMYRQALLQAGVPLPEKTTFKVFQELQQGWEGNSWKPLDLSENATDEAMRTISPMMMDAPPRRTVPRLDL